MIKKYLQYIKESDNINTSIDKGDWISYKLNDEEVWGEILNIRTIFRAYDDIETDYIVSDLKNKSANRIDHKDIIRKLKDLEIDSIKYNL